MDDTNKQIDNLLLQTIIFIMKEKTTGKPVVVTHFTGFQSDEEAQFFSRFLQDQFTTPLNEEDYNKNYTLH